MQNNIIHFDSNDESERHGAGITQYDLSDSRIALEGLYGSEPHRRFRRYPAEIIAAYPRLADADRFGMSDKAVFVVESFKDDHTGKEVVKFSAHLYDPSFLEESPDNPDFGYLIELFGEPGNVKQEKR